MASAHIQQIEIGLSYFHPLNWRVIFNINLLEAINEAYLAAVLREDEREKYQV